MGFIYLLFSSINAQADWTPNPEDSVNRFTESDYPDINESIQDTARIVCSYAKAVDYGSYATCAASNNYGCSGYFWHKSQDLVNGFYTYEVYCYANFETETEEPFECSNTTDVTSFWVSNYPDSITSIFENFHDKFEKQPVLQTLDLELPTSGTEPEFIANFNFGGFLNLGTYDLSLPSYIYGFIRLILLITAGFTCRSIIFGA